MLAGPLDEHARAVVRGRLMVEDQRLRAIPDDEWDAASVMARDKFMEMWDPILDSSSSSTS